MKPFVYVLRMADGNMSGTVEAVDSDDALGKAIIECKPTWKLPLLEAIIVEPTLPIERAKLPDPPTHIVSVYGMTAALSKYHKAASRAGDSRDIELARRDLVDWFERYEIRLDFTGEKELKP